MTEMPSKRRSGNRPSQDRTDTLDTRETIGLFYNRENIRRNMYSQNTDKILYVQHFCLNWFVTEMPILILTIIMYEVLEESGSPFKMLTCKTNGKRPSGRLRRRWEGSIVMNHKEISVNSRNLLIGLRIVIIGNPLWHWPSWFHKPRDLLIMYKILFCI